MQENGTSDDNRCYALCLKSLLESVLSTSTCHNPKTIRTVTRQTYHTSNSTCFRCIDIGLVNEKYLFIRKTSDNWREIHYAMLTLWEIVTERNNLSAGGRFRWQLFTSFPWFQEETYSPYSHAETDYHIVKQTISNDLREAEEGVININDHKLSSREITL